MFFVSSGLHTCTTDFIMHIVYGQLKMVYHFLISVFDSYIYIFRCIFRFTVLNVLWILNFGTKCYDLKTRDINNKNFGVFLIVSSFQVKLMAYKTCRTCYVFDIFFNQMFPRTVYKTNLILKYISNTILLLCYFTTNNDVFSRYFY